MSTATMLPVADRAAVRAYTLVVARRHPRLVGSVVGLASLATIAGLAGPRLLGTIVQDVQGGTTSGHIDRLAALLVLAICVQAVLNRYSYLAGKNFGETVLAELRESFVGSVLDLPLSRVEEAGSGDLINRASRDVTALRLAAQQGIPAVLGAGSSALLTFGALVLVSPPLAAVTLVTLPPLLLVVRWYLRYARDGYLATNATYSTMLENLTGTVEGAAAVEALGLGPQRIALSDADIARSWRAERVTLRLRLRLYPATEICQLAPAGLMLLAGGYGYTRAWPRSPRRRCTCSSSPPRSAPCLTGSTPSRRAPPRWPGWSVSRTSRPTGPPPGSSRTPPTAGWRRPGSASPTGRAGTCCGTSP
jgi:ABC-type multidrug transport system fused ATPase/permease subunit